MNRIILIGNGFDLAHGLKTSYAHFIDWYWKEWGYRLLHGQSKKEEDRLCSFVLKDSIGLGMWYYVWQGYYYKREKPWIPWDEHQVVELAMQNHDLCTFSMISPFFREVCQDVERKGWVDIENMFYTFLGLDHTKPKGLNDDLDYVRERLIEYLDTVQKAINNDTIIIDAINIKKEYRTRIVEMLSNYRTVINYVYVEAEGIDTNVGRRAGQIDRNTLLNMTERFEFPTREEYDNLYVFINNNENGWITKNSHE